MPNGNQYNIKHISLIITPDRLFFDVRLYDMFKWYP